MSFSNADNQRLENLSMNKSESIRSLGREGYSVVEIARRVGVRYQFARNVLSAAGMLKTGASRKTPVLRSASGAIPRRPSLTEETLVRAGFQRSSRWLLVNDVLKLEQPLPKDRGVYSMVKDRNALYVGVASMGLAKRFYFYARPGKTQRTSQRISELLRKELQSSAVIDVYTAMPPNLEWSGLPISGIAGLEQGLIEAFLLPWNIRGTSWGG